MPMPKQAAADAVWPRRQRLPRVALTATARPGRARARGCSRRRVWVCVKIMDRAVFLLQMYGAVLHSLQLARIHGATLRRWRGAWLKRHCNARG